MTTTSTVRSIVPRLVIAGADRAIDYYRDALGATLLDRFTGSGGKVVHAELIIGSGRVTIKDEDSVDVSATTLGGAPVIIELDVTDAQTVGAALVAAGGTVVFPVGDTSYGYRQGRIRDPFGLQWLISEQLEDLDQAETQRRLDAGAP